MKNLGFYDSDLQSDNPDDFHSDHEPPKDIVREKKLLKKTELLRIHKEIWQIGKGLPKPAKYDEIKLQFEEVQDPDAKQDTTDEEKKQLFESYIEHVKSVQQITPNLGLTNQEEWFEVVIESMKKGEVCFIILEYLKYDENKMKILDHNKYYMFYLEDWTTVIDLKQDMTILKKILQKGEGNHRTERQDEVIVNYCLKRGDEVLDERNVDDVSRIEQLLEQGLSEVVWRVIRSMKDKELCECSIKQEAFFNIESEKNKEKYKICEQDVDTKYTLSVNLKQLVRIDDIFGDQSAIKKEMLKGNSTAKPEKIARIYFELKIEVNAQIIYQSIEGDFPILTENQIFDFEYLEKLDSCWKFYLDEFKISKLLKNTLRRMKKQEYSVLECRDKSLIQYGQDCEIIKEKCNGAVPDFVKYHIKLYNFTDGKNTFSMTIDDKIEQAQRKKVVGVKLIKEQNFKKACKTFEAINAFFELGKFLGDDAIKVHPHKVSSLLNTSLCYQKTHKWDKLLLTCDKILEIEPNNAKAIYRKCVGLQEQSDFEKGIEIITNLLSTPDNQIDAAQLAELQKLKTTLIKSQQDYVKKQKQAFSKLFS